MIEEAKPMSKPNPLKISRWINAKARKPKPHKCVLVFCPDWNEEGYDIATWENFTNTKFWQNTAEQDMENFVTHWMPLPKNPTN